MMHYQSRKCVQTRLFNFKKSNRFLKLRIISQVKLKLDAEIVLKHLKIRVRKASSMRFIQHVIYV